MQPASLPHDAQESRQHAPGIGQWDIAPGESRRADGSLDLVDEASMESFPASDPPGYYGHVLGAPPE